MPAARILVHIEDPGAFTYIRPVVEALRSESHIVDVITDGQAIAMARQAGLEATAGSQVTSRKERINIARPEVVVVGTAESATTSGFDWIRLARERRIPTLGYVDSAANASHRFRGLSDDPLHHQTDVLLVSDHQAQQAFVQLGLPESRVVSCGHPNYDRVRAHPIAAEIRQRRREGGSGRKGPRVYFLAEISDGIGEQTYQRDCDYLLRGSGRFPDRTSIVMEEFLDACRVEQLNARLILRLHPKNRRDDFESLQPSFGEIQQGGCTLSSLRDADLVVGMTTALLDEAAILGIPTLSITPRICEAAWCSSISWGATQSVHTPQHLREQLGHFRDKGSLIEQRPLCLPPGGSVENVSRYILQAATGRLGKAA